MSPTGEIVWFPSGAARARTLIEPRPSVGHTCVITCGKGVQPRRQTGKMGWKRRYLEKKVALLVFRMGCLEAKMNLLERAINEATQCVSDTPPVGPSPIPTSDFSPEGEE